MWTVIGVTNTKSDPKSVDIAFSQLLQYHKILELFHRFIAEYQERL